MVQCYFVSVFTELNNSNKQNKFNITPYGENVCQLNYWDKIQNLVGYIFEKFLPLKKFGMVFWDETEFRFFTSAKKNWWFMTKNDNYTFGRSHPGLWNNEKRVFAIACKHQTCRSSQLVQ